LPLAKSVWVVLAVLPAHHAPYNTAEYSTDLRGSAPPGPAALPSRDDGRKAPPEGAGSSPAGGISSLPARWGTAGAAASGTLRRVDGLHSGLWTAGSVPKRSHPCRQTMCPSFVSLKAHYPRVASHLHREQQDRGPHHDRFRYLW